MQPVIRLACSDSGRAACVDRAMARVPLFVDSASECARKAAYARRRPQTNAWQLQQCSGCSVERLGLRMPSAAPAVLCVALCRGAGIALVYMRQEEACK